MTKDMFAEMTAEERSGAVISPCGAYRYHLWRRWDDCLPVLVYVMQNPSTADASTDDPTIKKCIHFARRDGFGSISVRNVFALRATDERELLKHPDPFGPENELHLYSAREVSIMARIVVAWGNRFGSKALYHWYSKAAGILALNELYCLGINKSGEPKHPLFMAHKTPIIRYKRTP